MAVLSTTPALGEAVALAAMLSSNRTNMPGYLRLRDLAFVSKNGDFIHWYSSIPRMCSRLLNSLILIALQASQGRY